MQFAPGQQLPLHRFAGPTLSRAAEGAFVWSRANFILGNHGLLDAASGRVLVGNGVVPSPGAVRVGANGRLRGSGRIIGRVEVLGGGSVMPGGFAGNPDCGGRLCSRGGRTVGSRSWPGQWLTPGTTCYT